MAGSRTRAADMILARGQSRLLWHNGDTDPRRLVSSLHHCSTFKVRMLPIPFNAWPFHLSSGHLLSTSSSTSFPLWLSYFSHNTGSTAPEKKPLVQDIFLEKHREGKKEVWELLFSTSAQNSRLRSSDASEDTQVGSWTYSSYMDNP